LAGVFYQGMTQVAGTKLLEYEYDNNSTGTFAPSTGSG
jgi:hypothetical protein